MFLAVTSSMLWSNIIIPKISLNATKLDFHKAIQLILHQILCSVDAGKCISKFGFWFKMLFEAIIIGISYNINFASFFAYNEIKLFLCASS